MENRSLCILHQGTVNVGRRDTTKGLHARLRLQQRHLADLRLE
jgi:hypothetical protein